MFTGLVESVGVVESIGVTDAGGARLSIISPEVLDDVAVGDSIAVEGCCLTVTQSDGERWCADLMRSTLEATALATVSVGDRMNLERAAKLGQRIGGHIVQGHIDGVGVIASRVSTPDWDLVEVDLPADLARFVAAKGSIALGGVSLTVVAVSGCRARVSLVPHTLSATTLGSWTVGDRVNVEVDILAKYVLGAGRGASGGSAAAGAA